MTQPERILGTTAAIIGIFVFVTGIPSIRHVFQDTKVIHEYRTEQKPTNHELPTSEKQDRVFVSLLKAIAVVVFMLVGVLLTPICFIADLFSLLFGQTFPSTRGMWHWIWDIQIAQWFWQPVSLFKFSLLIVLIVVGAVAVAAMKNA